MSTFDTLGLDAPLIQAIQDLGFTKPSEVQQKAIPILLGEETDLVALAQTGTGKTAAFGFPLIQKIDPSRKHTQGLILSPTRELCLQITNEIKLYAKYIPGLHTVAIYGGASITEQASQIKRGAQIVVATPGRMKDMINRGLINITQIDYCILDEADEMLNMGFYEDIQDILSNTPREKRTWLFSATMPKEVSVIAKKFMNQPVEITVGSKNSGASTIVHEYYVAGSRDRYQALKRLADAHPEIFSVVFCRTKRDCQKVAENLIEDGYNAAALHGDLSQNQRDLVMSSFRKKQIQMLVATDVAARGIDVDDITHVINYQLPDEIETYTHRSGRTGRAGKEGVSMVIVTRSELRKISHIEKIIQQKFTLKNIPTGMEICEIQLFALANKIKNTEINHDVDEYLPKINEVLDGLTKEELIKKIVSVEFGRFYNYYNKTRDLNASESSDRGDRAERSEGYSNSNPDSVRYFINVGSRDGFNWGTLKDFIRDTVGLGKDDVYKVDVKDSFSFFNSDTTAKDIILETFHEFKVDGRFINVEVSTEGPGNFKGKPKGKRDFDRPGFKKSKSSFDKGGYQGKGGFDKKKKFEFDPAKKSKRRQGFG
ncbi:MAG: DEAD/DEAH box helicase [Flavobacteriaceae bacterium]